MTTAPATSAVCRLALNTPRRFYRGGERILAFRGLPVPDDFDGNRPEDWLASTTQLFAEGGDGLTTLAGGADLATALAQDPVLWLGPDHAAERGPETGLLTKLLDSGERLPVHSHPDRRFAAAHLDCDHGKTEAWIVLDADPGAVVWLGFREDLPADTLADLVAAQDDRLLAALNEIPVTAGDAILVPAGQPHAIGEGVLILELQEPTDFSVMLEHRRFGLEEDHAFLGLPRALALESVDRAVLDATRLAHLSRRWLPTTSGASTSTVEWALPAEASEFFRAEVVSSRGDHTEPAEPVVLDPAFAITVVVDGRGTLATDGDPVTLDIARGDVLLVPHGAGHVRIAGDVTVIRCMPPATGSME